MRLALPYWIVSMLLMMGATACGPTKHTESFKAQAPSPVIGTADDDDGPDEIFRTKLSPLTAAEAAAHKAGGKLFDAAFSHDPASEHPGLGAFFNNDSCDGCHHNDGRGLALLTPASGHSQMIVRYSLAHGTFDERDGAAALPGLGLQMHDQAANPAELACWPHLDWRQQTVKLADGTSVVLRQPQLELSWSSMVPYNKADVLTSLRASPSLVGMGLIDAVADDTLRGLEASSHTYGRIPGRLNWVWSRSKGAMSLGRFGYKSNTATLMDQVAGAAANDMGLTNPLFPRDGSKLTLSKADIDAMTTYAATLAVPARRNISDAAVQRGQDVFRTLKCASCHLEQIPTSAHAVAALAYQTAHPYSDLLLHDMGDGLADGRPDFQATGREWRTAPLWGLGLTHTVLQGATFLHDGRALTVTEAILWHGGQAQASRDGFSRLSAGQRQDLLTFLDSL